MSEKLQLDKEPVDLSAAYSFHKHPQLLTQPNGLEKLYSEFRRQQFQYFGNEQVADCICPVFESEKSKHILFAPEFLFLYQAQQNVLKRNDNDGDRLAEMPSSLGDYFLSAKDGIPKAEDLKLKAPNFKTILQDDIQLIRDEDILQYKIVEVKFAESTTD